ncbi:TonB family protein [Massilia sp. S19_KUP03_FR1]|uniref:TonB family protein n=1 Tax=Massilia sp. S19_KUP03_FR1 TaxID=3025503 RepID=UPI002FCDCDF0
MKTAFLLLTAAVALLPAPTFAARAQNPQDVMVLDLQACPRPAYPPAALAQRVGGKTTIEVQVGEAGVATEARVAVSSGRDDLDQAALASMRRCVFHAVVTTGQAPTGWLKTHYVWEPGAAKQVAAQDQALFASTLQHAEGGDAVAQNRLGTWYQHGTYGTPDLVQAASWYARAAENGNAYAQNNLGVLYYRGTGVARDLRQAVDWYAKAAEQGHSWAQANLSWAYQFGAGRELDMDQAMIWLTRAAEGGLADAQLRLGLLAMQRAVSDEDRSAAAAWIARAAAHGFPAGLYYLGRTFELGLGNPQDDAQAAARYRLAVERSAGRAETALGTLLEAGRAGDADQAGAAKLYQKAMQWRYPPAYYHYGMVLEQRGDTALAAVVLRQGADMGNCAASLKYLQLRQGAGPAGDPSEARIELLATRCSAALALPPNL